MINDKHTSTNTALTIEYVIEQYGSYIYNLACRLSANPANAEDLAQETFIKAWLHISNLKDDAAIKKWLRTICINEFRMKMRKEKRGDVSYVESVEELENDGQLLISTQPSPADETEAEEAVISLRNGCFLAMTRKLTLNQRIAFSLIDMFGLSISEVSEILNLTPKAVKGLLYRARTNLESFFQGHCSFLDMSNPCRCTAWIDFMQARDSVQDKMKQRMIQDTDYLDYRKKGYIHNREVSEKILSYYHVMPEQRPSQEWFAGVIRLVEEFYQ